MSAEVIQLSMTQAGKGRIRKGREEKVGESNDHS